MITSTYFQGSKNVTINTLDQEGRATDTTQIQIESEVPPAPPEPKQK